MPQINEKSENSGTLFVRTKDGKPEVYVRTSTGEEIVLDGVYRVDIDSIKHGVSISAQVYCKLGGLE